MTNANQTQQQALKEGMRAVSRTRSKGSPKIGVDEFMALAERFGFSSDTLTRMRALIDGEDLGSGPFLAHYCSGLEESRVQAFERTARKVFGAPYAIGTSSGTGALHAAMVAAGVERGREVICPAIGFYATAAAVVLAGGIPVFCDVDGSLGMSAKALRPLINSRTVALAPTHVMGNVCAMDQILDVAREHRLRVVEDCAQACGARFGGQFVGTLGDFGCFSISAYKIFGGGEGGLVLTGTERDADRVNAMVEGGGLWRPQRFAPPRYEGELLVGSNYRMSELEACIDVVQLEKLESTVERFRDVKRWVTERLWHFEGIDPQLRPDPMGELGYQLRFFPSTEESAFLIAEALKAAGVHASTRAKRGTPDWHIYHYMYPLHGLKPEPPSSARHTYFKGACPNADDLYERMVSVPLNQWYSEEDSADVAQRINTVLSAHCPRVTTGPAW